MRDTTTVRRAAVFALASLFTVGCRKPAPSSNLKAENKVTMRTVRLYYESPEMLLRPETRNLELPANPAGALSATVRELLKGSANSSVPRLFPADVIVLGVYLIPDGTAFVDLGGPTVSNGWGSGSHGELMAIHSVVETVTTNFPEAKRVRFLINGEPAETLGGHISLSKSVSPSPAWVDRALR